MTVSLFGLILFVFTIPTVLAKINDAGTVSWSKFDEIKIPAAMDAEQFFLWKMPRIVNYTGMLGLSGNATNSNLWGQVGFIASVQGCPADYQYSNFVYIEAGIEGQSPATYGTGSDEWCLLFISLPTTIGLLKSEDSMVISFYIIEMETIYENQVSTPINLYSGQDYNFKIIMSSPFEAGTTILIQLSNQCAMNAFIGIDEIPNIWGGNNVVDYVQLSKAGSVLFYTIQLTNDCDALSIQIGRVPSPIVVVPGQVVHLPAGTFLSPTNKALFTSPSSSALNVTISAISSDCSDYTLLFSFGVANFNPAFAIPYEAPIYSNTFYMSNPSPWYFELWQTFPYCTLNNITIEFTNPIDYPPFGVEFPVEEQPEYDLIHYRLPNTSYFCIEFTSNIFFDNVITSTAPITPPLLLASTVPSIYYSCVINPNMTLGDTILTLQFSLGYTGAYYEFSHLSGSVVNYGEWTEAPLNTPFLYHLPNPRGDFTFVKLTTVNNSCSGHNSALNSMISTTDNIQDFPSFVNGFPDLLKSPSTNGWYLVGRHLVGPPCVFKADPVYNSRVFVSFENPVKNVSLNLTETMFILNSTSLPVPAGVGMIHVVSDVNMTCIHVKFDQKMLYVSGFVGSVSPTVVAYTPSSANLNISAYDVSELVIPAIATGSGAYGQEYYVAVYAYSGHKEIKVQVEFVSEKIVQLELPQTKVQVESSNDVQIFRFPYDPSYQVLTSSLVMPSTNPNTTNAIFGAGGYQVTYDQSGNQFQGMSISPRTNNFFATSLNHDFYLLIFPNSPSLTLTLTPKPVHYMCNPIFLCNGNGVCHDDRLEPSCVCIDGFGYGFSGAYCDVESYAYIWVTSVCSGAVILFFIVAKMTIFIISKRKIQENSDNREYLPLNHDGKSEYYSTSSSPLRDLLIPIKISLEKVSFSIKDKNLLSSITMEMAPGEVTAMLGPSGAGKSTLLKILTGRIRPCEGNIYFNSQKTENISQFSSLIGYVPQDDVMNPHLTIRENLMHSALMRLPSNLQFSQKEALVDHVITALGLKDLQHTIVGDLGGQSSLSGGQRKRVSVGIELVTCPSILFLDEPTSGLDSKTALSLIRLLKTEIAMLGVSIVVVVHQPRNEILEICDKIALLSEGTLKYFGSSQFEEISKYFPRLYPEKYGKRRFFGGNAADVMIDHIDEFQPMPSVSISTLPILPRLIPRTPASFLTQFRLLTKRALLQSFRDTNSFIVLYGLIIVCALLLGFMFRNARFIGPPSPNDIGQCPVAFQYLCAQNQQDSYMSQGLFLSLAIGLIAAASALSTFGGTEKLVFVRESQTGQSNIAYAMAKLVSVILNQSLAPFIFISIFQYLSTPAVPFWKILLVACGIFEACMNFSHFLSLLMSDNQALIATAGGICIQNMVAGYNPTLHQLKQSLGIFGTILSSISYSRWSCEAFYLGIVSTFKGIYDVKFGLKLWGYHLSEETMALTIPFGIGLVFRVLVIVIIVIKAKFFNK